MLKLTHEDDEQQELSHDEAELCECPEHTTLVCLTTLTLTCIKCENFLSGKPSDEK